jgi:hypothetical protein
MSKRARSNRATRSWIASRRCSFGSARGRRGARGARRERHPRRHPRKAGHGARTPT